MSNRTPITCPHCGNDDPTLLERQPMQTPLYLCMSCSKQFVVTKKV